MARSGSPYSTPRDANRVPLLVAASTVDGVTPVVLEADPTTHLLQVSSSGGGGGGTQYVEGVTTSPATGNVFLGRYKATPPSLTDGQLNGLQLDSAGNLKVTGSLSIGGTTDNSAYTAGSSTGTPAMGFYHSTIDAVTDGRAATVAITANRASHTNLRNASGTEIGTSSNPVQVSLANTAANATAVKVDGSAVTQPVSAASLPLPTGAATSGNQATEITSLATIAALSKAEDAPHSSGDTGVPVWAVRNDTGAVFAGSDGDYIPLATDATGALRVDLNGTISTNNSTTVVLAGNAAFTGTSEDALNYNEIRISVIASHVSATDGLSIQQSEDNTNWDFTDTYTIPAATGKTYSIPRQARYFRVVYTNGATLQTSFRLQTIMNRLGARVSSQRPNDAYSNETDLEQTQSFLMGYNGTTWDRLRTTGTGVLTTSTVLTTGAAAIGSLAAGSAIIGKVGIDQTTPGTTNAVSANQGTAAALSGGWVVINGEQNDTTGTFTNATQTTSVTATNLAGYGNVLVSINGTYGTATAIFEGSDDGGTTWYTISEAARTDTNVVEGGYTSLTNVTRAWQTNNPGWDSLRVRSTAVASGTVNVRISPSAAPSAAGATVQLGSAIPTGSNVIGHVIADTGSTTAVTQATAASLNATVVGNGTFVTQSTLQTQTDTVMVGGVNVKEINAVTPLMGNGVTGTGSQRVTIASDNTAFAVNATLSAETTKVIGTVNVAASQTIAVTNTGTFATQPTIQTGTNSIGKISDITTSVVPGTAATNLGKAEDAAHTTGDTGVMALGVRNDTLADTTNTNADYAQLSTDIKGRVMTAGAPRSLKGMAQVSISASTSETTILAATASTFHDVYGIILANTGATTTKVSIRDDTAGTVRAIIEVPTLETRGFMLPVDSAVPQTAVNKNWTAQCGSSTTALEVTLLYVSMV